MTTMSAVLSLEAIGDLTKATATDVKKTGWRGLMKKLAREGKGKLVITNNHEAQAVILSAEQYDGIVEALRSVSVRREADLGQLRRDFDARLASLNEPGAGGRLRRVLREPIGLGNVRAGESY